MLPAGVGSGSPLLQLGLTSGTLTLKVKITVACQRKANRNHSRTQRSCTVAGREWPGPELRGHSSRCWVWRFSRKGGILAPR